MKVGSGLALLAAVGGIGVSATAASAAHYPNPVTFLVNRDRPVAGRAFTAVTINDYASGVSVSCGKAFVGKTRLTQQAEPVRSLNGYEQTVCRWPVPHGTAGKHLRVVGAEANRPDWQSAVGPNAVSWRIRPHHS